MTRARGVPIVLPWGPLGKEPSLAGWIVVAPMRTTSGQVSLVVRHPKTGEQRYIYYQDGQLCSVTIG